MIQQETAVEFQNISKTFPGVKALDDVSFNVQKGKVHALVGENGAGKSTLLNILHGVYPEYDGTVLLSGESIHFGNTHDAIRAGIAKVHQEILLVPELTVGQNIFLGHEPHKGPFVDYKAMHTEADDLLAMLKSPLRSEDSIRGASTGEMQMVSIAKALLHDAKVISFDEPTSSLSSSEVDVLFGIIKELRDRDITMLYVSHRLVEIFDIADYVTVLRDGQHIGTFPVSEITRQDLIRMMVGRDVSSFAKRQQERRYQDERVLEVRNLTTPGVFEDVSFHLRKGEILGFAGLVGAKRTDVLRAVFGADPYAEGEVLLNGKPVKIESPEQAVELGIGLVPENRKTEGFVRYLTNENNIALTCLPRFEKLGLLRDKDKLENAEFYVKKMNITPPRADFVTDNMSGGNQQKVVVAKWLSTHADIIILDEPTKGIDIGAKEEIYALLEELVAEGKSLIVVSSELPEVIGLCDRVIVMREGRKIAELSHEELSEERVLHFAMEGGDE